MNNRLAQKINFGTALSFVVKFIHIVICLVVIFLCSRHARAGDEKEELILRTKILLKQESNSMYEIAATLRQIFPVDVENDSIPVGATLRENHTTELRANFPTGEVSVNDLIRIIKEKLGYNFSITNETLVFTDPKLAGLKLEYPLNTQIEDLVLENVSAVEAVNAMATKLNLPISALTIRSYSQMNSFSIHLSHVSVREALDMIAKKAKLPGWNSSIGRSTARGLDKMFIFIVL